MSDPGGGGKEGAEKTRETVAETGFETAADASSRTFSMAPSTNHADDDNSDTDRGSPPPGPSTVLLRLRGLPYGANERDLGRFFEGHRVVAAFICRRAGNWLLQFFFFSSCGTGAKALSRGRTFFSLARSRFFFSSLNLKLNLTLSIFSLLPHHRQTHGRRLRRVRNASGRRPRPRREAARLSREPVRRALRRGRGGA